MTRPPWRPATLCVHGPHVSGGGAPLVAPIVRSSIFRLDDAIYAERAAGHPEKTHVYTRETNPTLERVEGRLAALEGAERALVFASGMAALHAILMALVLIYSSNLCACLTHYGTTPAPIYYGANYVSQARWWTIGLAVSVQHILVWGIVGALWWKMLGWW